MVQEGIPEKFFMDRMKKYSKEVFKTSLLSEPTAVFCGAAANKFLFSNENKLVSLAFPRNIRKIFPYSATPTTTIADSSLKLRVMLLGFFKPDVLHNLVEVVDSVAKKHFQTHWDSKKKSMFYHLSRSLPSRKPVEFF
ncbi:beta-amyrin 28-monooxygenase-like [Coffea arabica]|uniref:Beta-amyrin 28-monooxygenase-like n=1 Tax=Coffea arabica TaxID=13443 RepID=A0ABM4VCH3_COFAR